MINNNPPARTRDWALFLDVDGTLIEIANTPDSVCVPSALHDTLLKAFTRENGAMALVSGRGLNGLEMLFPSLEFPMAALHGALRRDAKGRLYKPPTDPSALNAAREALSELALRHPGLMLEDKRLALALHFRNAPTLANEAKQAVEKACVKLGSAFEVQAGKCVYEIKLAGYTKGTAIEAFMLEYPFAGRVPVFVGDDLTDESGFVAVNNMDGFSIRVGQNNDTAAKFCLPDVGAVVRWLDNL